MNFKVIVTSGFKKHAKRIAKKHSSLKSDISILIDSLEVKPIQGDPLGSNCYKVRMAIKSKGKGKRGGSRVITLIRIVEKNVYLLTIYDKSEKESISDGELNDLLKFAGL